MNDLGREILDEVKALRKDVASFAKQTERNRTDIAWLKRLVGGAGAAILMLASHVLRKLGI